MRDYLENTVAFPLLRNFVYVVAVSNNFSLNSYWDASFRRIVLIILVVNGIEFLLYRLFSMGGYL